MSSNDNSRSNSTWYFNREQDSSEEEVDVSNYFNQTCPLPRDRKKFDFNKSYSENMQHLEEEDRHLQYLVEHTSRTALINQDPCTIPDEMREILMRTKRKEEAYKTALCDSYRRTQTCAYGDGCSFAHGVLELRLPSNPRGRNHPKYKTVLCDKFSTTGMCKYGTRCQFIHRIANPAIFEHVRSGLSPEMSAALSQSMISAVDMNQSLPIRSSDINRAYARLHDHNPSVTRFAKLSNNLFRQQLPPFQ